jgi:hypothetical protein
MTSTGVPSCALDLPDFAAYCFEALDLVAPERSADLHHAMAAENVRLAVLPDTFGLLFQVGPDHTGHYTVIETSPIACYLLWAVAWDCLASMAATYASEGWRMPNGWVPDPADAEEARQGAAAALDWVERAITTGDMSGVPPKLPRRRPSDPLPLGAEQDLEVLATELALCGAGWVMHHELAHARLNHLQPGVDILSTEEEADREATEWLLAGAAGAAVKKRSLGIAVATLTLVRLEDRIGRVPNPDGSYDYPAAIERLRIALGDRRIDELATGVAAIALMRVMEGRQLPAPAGLTPDMPARELLEELCSAYRRATLT